MNNTIIMCPLCKAKTHTQIKKDTVLKNFPLFCPKCKHEVIIDATNLQIKLARR